MSRTHGSDIRVASAGGESSHPPREHVDCVILVITYNSARHIGKLLDSLPAAAFGLSTRCLVLDNGSHDNTMRIVHSRAHVTAVEMGANLGYSGAINIGRTMAGPCSSLLILNPDLVLEPGAVARLYEELGETSAGVVVPMLLKDDGSIYPSLRREPSLSRALGDALFGAHWRGRPAWLSNTVFDSISYQRPHDVDWASGAVMLLSSACNDAVGAWDDTRFFLYSEETDFAARARRCGFRIRYVPAARACHEEGGSGQSPALSALLAVNDVRYYEKYHRRPATSVFRSLAVLRYFLRRVCHPREPGNRAALRMLTLRARWRNLPGSNELGDGHSTPGSRRWIRRILS
jgi:GT2 family glycosyltransferase